VNTISDAVSHHRYENCITHHPPSNRRSHDRCVASLRFDAKYLPGHRTGLWHEEELPAELRQALLREEEGLPAELHKALLQKVVMLRD
jgi:hypothetical protein